MFVFEQIVFVLNLYRSVDVSLELFLQCGIFCFRFIPYNWYCCESPENKTHLTHI